MHALQNHPKSAVLFQNFKEDVECDVKIKEEDSNEDHMEPLEPPEPLEPLEPLEPSETLETEPQQETDLEPEMKYESKEDIPLATLR